MSFQVRMLLMMSVIVILSNILLFYMLSTSSHKLVEATLGAQTRQIALSIVKRIDMEKLRRVTELTAAIQAANQSNNAVLEMQEYKELRRQLSIIKKRYGLTYLFTMAENAKGQFMYVVDGFPLNHEGSEVSLPAHVERTYYRDLEEAFKYRKITVSGLTYSEKWGANVSTFVPLFDSRNAFIGVLGVDMDGTEIHRLFTANQHRTIAISITFILLGLLATYFMTRYLVSPLQQLVRKIHQVKEGDLRTEAVSGRKDEIGQLTRAFNEMVSVFYYNELKKRNEDLHKNNQFLLQINQVKDEFLASTSHELRTPLNGIIGLCESILGKAGEQLSERTFQNIKMILSSAKRLSGLIQDLLDYTRLRKRSIELHPHPVDVSRTVREVADVLRVLAKANVEIVDHISSPLWVMAENKRLEQILYNLMGNAVKYTPEGEVVIEARQKGDVIEIAVRDSGIGIPEESLDRIFHAYEQAGYEGKQKVAGTGLGLFITKYLIELQGGSISCSSVPGSGTTFRFTLPAAAEPCSSSLVEQGAEPAYRQEAAPALEERRTTPIERETEILIVEDDPVNVQVIREYLSVRRWNLTVVETGKEALERAASQQFHLILLDIQLLDITGYDVCRAIRKTFSESELPILLLTTKNEMPAILEGFRSGANDYLIKPLSREELLVRMDTQLTIVQSARELTLLKEAVQTSTSYIHHAIKNDLGVLGLFADKISDYASDHDFDSLQRDALVMRRKIEHAMGILKRVNHMTSDIVLRKQKLDLIETIEQAVASCREQAPDVNIQTAYRPTTLLLAYDPVHIEEALHNILQNSIEEMKESGGRIDVELVQEGATVKITVTDNGPGIAREHLPYIKQLYFSTKRRGSNFGLGLFYCENIMHAHGGALEIVSTEGVGTTVYLYLSITRE
ncbi:ATP-binding protein [Paenibacillus tarimensis]|uniref:ATP-binding protein n=1 Tax=Paenibacillus tarimensis TaxID=416012 RepID=UPI001F369502|nr:ATP-binding protein [Paenibacillus tarimensis]MCF2942781.1 ATP-binding protein [Paenibacillus tarimensis]